MTPDAFRLLALSFPRTREVPFLGSQEFRVRERTFATLGWPEPGWAILRLTPADQARLLSATPALAPEPGGRGKRGVTRLRLAALHEGDLKPILKAAWRAASEPSHAAGPVAAKARPSAPPAPAWTQTGSSQVIPLFAAARPPTR
ncbi:MAG: hypothetical protein P4L64_09395 [Caulobacteraceae bacterium]|nr:hypothetical protein [Caulobacteraceae bacterium]